MQRVAGDVVEPPLRRLARALFEEGDAARAIGSIANRQAEEVQRPDPHVIRTRRLSGRDGLLRQLPRS